jgi:hypothetical protein
METTKNTQIEAVSNGLLDLEHQEKRHKVLIRDIQQESLKETPPKLLHGNPKRRPRKSPKRKNGSNKSKPRGTTPNHLYMPKRFIQGLACRPIILPSHKISP